MFSLLFPPNIRTCRNSRHDRPPTDAMRHISTTPVNIPLPQIQKSATSRLRTALFYVHKSWNWQSNEVLKTSVMYTFVKINLILQQCITEKSCDFFFGYINHYLTFTLALYLLEQLIIPSIPQRILPLLLSLCTYVQSAWPSVLPFCPLSIWGSIVVLFKNGVKQRVLTFPALKTWWLRGMLHLFQLKLFD